MKRYFDHVYQRLIYIGHTATNQAWDRHWHTDDFRKMVTATPNSWIISTTRKYLPAGSRILEGGCGRGNHVFALQKNGFEAVGVDFAPKTVENLRKCAPELNIELGDVRALQFEDNAFDGYWSLGVIEHFWHGFEEIAKEMNRVIRRDGYLFITFPCISRLRQWKAENNKYPEWIGGITEPMDFYQFALSPQDVNHTFSKFGFKIIKQRYFTKI